MTLEELDSTTSEDARQLTRRRREQRVDHVLEIPFNENRVEVECPDCGQEFPVTIACNDPQEYSPTYGPCLTWGCEAYFKYVDDPSERSVDAEPTSEQTNLDHFDGGASA